MNSISKAVPETVAMQETYFRHVRREIAPLLPETATRILDVGAGAGLTAAWVKSLYPGAHATAIEGNPAMEPELRRHVDDVRIVDLDGPLPDVGSPDLVLFLDVLEHLVRPEEVLKRLTSTLGRDGTVIVSVPNVAHASVSIPLLLGRFDYRSAGILDRTHLRFFVRETAVALLESAGLSVVGGLRLGFDGPRTGLLDRLTGGALRDQLTKQYVLAAVRRADGQGRPAFRWGTS